MDGAISPRLDLALRQGPAALDALVDSDPVDERDGLLALATIHDLHLASIDDVGPAVRWQHHPTVAMLKARLERRVLDELPASATAPGERPLDAVGEMRRIAHVDLVPDVYRWLADDAGWAELVHFLALEGGPDAGFDDLVAICQVGLSGEPKLEMARNYWDEMGRGSLDEVHAELHHRLSRATRMPRIPRRALPVSALRRSILGGILATNRWLQPEMIGALGLLELQAGPRCRQVIRALDRLDAPEGARPFYVEHAEVDPQHGKAWLDLVVAPLASDSTWAAGILRGARWRSAVNNAFFHDMAERFVTRSLDRRVSA